MLELLVHEILYFVSTVYIFSILEIVSSWEHRSISYKFRILWTLVVSPSLFHLEIIQSYLLVIFYFPFLNIPNSLTFILLLCISFLIISKSLFISLGIRHWRWPWRLRARVVIFFLIAMLQLSRSLSRFETQDINIQLQFNNQSIF